MHTYCSVYKYGDQWVEKTPGKTALGKNRWNIKGRMLIIVEMRGWVNRGSFLYSFYVCVYVKISIIIFNIFMEKLKLLSNFVLLWAGRQWRGKEALFLHASSSSSPLLPPTQWPLGRGPEKGQEPCHLTSAFGIWCLCFLGLAGIQSWLFFRVGMGFMLLFRDSPLLGLSHWQVP